VERAVQLISNGALDDAGVEVLAERLGIGPRHLSRLFRKHLGASSGRPYGSRPKREASLDETDLSITEIALRSGFRSLRRFNTVLAEVYKRPPTEIRRARFLK
jgi:AraC family transcriptional regulator of adaptative response / DNA-3-methyladenine glycosylase II